MKHLIARLRGYRTFIAGAILGLAPLWDSGLQILHLLAIDPDLPKIIPEAWRSQYAFVTALVMIYMRVITATRAGRRE